MSGFVPADKYQALASGYEKLGLKGAAEAVEYERIATGITMVDLNALPDPLRSDEYAGVLYAHGQRRKIGVDKFDKLTELHAQRQELLRQRLESGALSSLQLVAGEWAVANALWYDGAINTLRQADDHKRIGVHVVPIGSGIHAVTGESPFTIFTMPGGAGVVLAGSDRRAKLVHDPDDVLNYKKAASAITETRQAISLDESLARIEGLRQLQ